jgi:hypothetical protein
METMTEGQLGFCYHAKFFYEGEKHKHKGGFIYF